MKLNISFPATGCQKLIEVDDERKLRTFYEKRMATEVAADALGEELKGEKDIPGLTDTTVPCRLGPKRASRIRKLFNLSKEDDVRQ
ncbi:40S ribosomal protein S6 [Camelus dromedarius]|uniref:Small ribosomal subunit protein eS6 n=1 Tax=Camelus dromedarius TaxID=9838 RepID=A0A5N4CSW1_CAMDR|nr:40S ribosomal protein S6 [Camelus dromedarius]